MILLNKLHYLFLLASFVFTLTMFLKIFMNIKDLRYSISGVFYFVIMAIEFPIYISNDIYNKRDTLIRKANSDTKLNNEQKRKLKKLVNSRIRLYLTFGLEHFLHFPNFIESYSEAYVRWYEKTKSRKNNTHNGSSPLNEIKKMESGQFPDLFNTLKEVTI